MGRRGNGEGTIYKRKDGKWTAQITVDIDEITGKVIRKTFYGKQRREVAEKLTTFLSQKENFLTNGKHMKLKEWFPLWLNTYNQNVAFSTYDDYESKIYLHILPALGEIELCELKPLMIQKLYNEKAVSGRVDGREGGLSRCSIRYIHVVLRAALEQAKREGYLTINPADAVKLPKSVNDDTLKRKVLTREEQLQFFEKCRQEKLFPLFVFAMLTGCREGEILALKWNQIDFDKKEITIDCSVSVVKKRLKELKNKTYDNISLVNYTDKTMRIVKGTKTASSTRTIPMCSELVTIMKAHAYAQKLERMKNISCYKNEDYVFATRYGGMLDYRFVIRKFHQYLKKANIDTINFHSLRHTFSTRLLEEGVSMKIVQEYLGHKSYNLTANTYSHVLPQVKKDEIECLNRVFCN